MFSKNILSNIITTKFPSTLASWAYGSAVFPQSSSSSATSSNMIDLFLVVKDPYLFHTQNIKMNPTHYSGLSYLLGSGYIHLINKFIFPIHFNSHITIDGYKVKYGVVSQDIFKQDLQKWRYLTVSGRLQKPVKFLHNQQKYKKYLQLNLKSALSYAFLIAQQKSLQTKLYQQICRLSYIGDIRYSVNLQNKSKVENIVNHNFKNFQQLYHPIINKHFKDHLNFNNNTIQINKSKQSIEYFHENSIYSGLDIEQLKQKIKETNRWSSISMACYHACSSSWIKNLTYISQKAKKAQSK